ncbi:MAG: hypothetical protein KF736_09885 [Acidobacteria bacterium]|nr:hypothetical protein [Acidobacteriota bacterium]
MVRLFSPSSKAEIAEIIADARQRAGADWLKAIRHEYPMFSWMIDLVVNYDAEHAYAHLSDQYPDYPLWMFKRPLFELHHWLRSEIDRPREVTNVS